MSETCELFISYIDWSEYNFVLTTFEKGNDDYTA
jgi:hypothetical protein